MDHYENLCIIYSLTEGLLHPVPAVVSATRENCDLAGKVKTTDQMHKKGLKKIKRKDKNYKQNTGGCLFWGRKKKK